MSDLFYLDFNSSSPKVAVLIHGLGANSNMWQFQWKKLENAGYRVIVPDMRGFGNSPYSGTGSLDQMARDVRDLLDELKIEKADIIGLSMGGAVALDFVLNYPERVNRIVLSNTAARFANPVGAVLYKGMRKVLMSAVPRATAAKMMAALIFPRPHQGEFRKEFTTQIMQVSDQAYLSAVRSLMRHDFRKRLNEIKCPVLITGGKRDKVTPNFLQRFMERNISGAKLIVLEGSGHVGAVDASDDYNKALLDFLGENR